MRRKVDRIYFWHDFKPEKYSVTLPLVTSWSISTYTIPPTPTLLFTVLSPIALRATSLFLKFSYVIVTVLSARLHLLLCIIAFVRIGVTLLWTVAACVMKAPFGSEPRIFIQLYWRNDDVHLNQKACGLEETRYGGVAKLSTVIVVVRFGCGNGRCYVEASMSHYSAFWRWYVQLPRGCRFVVDRILRDLIYLSLKVSVLLITVGTALTKASKVGGRSLWNHSQNHRAQNHALQPNLPILIKMHHLCSSYFPISS